VDNISNISIDRLVLDILGLTAEQGKQVAQHLAAGLSASNVQPGDHARLSITLPANASGVSPERLANSILTAMLRQIG
jgi:hypothetical protein